MDDLESLRQLASENGDCELSRLCNEAMWGDDEIGRARAHRQVATLTGRQ